MGRCMEHVKCVSLKLHQNQTTLDLIIVPWVWRWLFSSQCSIFYFHPHLLLCSTKKIQSFTCVCEQCLRSMKKWISLLFSIESKMTFLVWVKVKVVSSFVSHSMPLVVLYISIVLTLFLSPISMKETFWQCQYIMKWEQCGSSHFTHYTTYV